MKPKMVKHCAGCGREDSLTRHHVVPRSQGGAGGTIQILCLPCHQRVHNILPKKAELTEFKTPKKALVLRRIQIQPHQCMAKMLRWGTCPTCGETFKDWEFKK